jgi:hypothetical protein
VQRQEYESHSRKDRVTVGTVFEYSFPYRPPLANLILKI